VVFDAAIRPCAPVNTLSREKSSGQSGAGMLLADRGFYGVDLWRTATAMGADLLWRVRKGIVLVMVEQLPDDMTEEARFCSVSL
jgi:hypothetical protein